MRLLRRVCVAIVLTVFAAPPVKAGVSPSGTIVGTVTLTTADGGTVAGDGARVVLACGADRTTRTEVADAHGAFRFVNVPIDSCSIDADVQGFAAQPVTVVTATQQVVGVDLQLGIAPVRAGVNVGGTVLFQEPKMPLRSCRSQERRRLGQSAQGCTRKPGRR